MSSGSVHGSLLNFIMKLWNRERGESWSWKLTLSPRSAWARPGCRGTRPRELVSCHPRPARSGPSAWPLSAGPGNHLALPCDTCHSCCSRTSASIMLDFVLLPVFVFSTGRRASFAKAVCTERPVNARDGFHGHRRRARAWRRGLSSGVVSMSTRISEISPLGTDDGWTFFFGEVGLKQSCIWQQCNKDCATFLLCKMLFPFSACCILPYYR